MSERVQKMLELREQLRLKGLEDGQSVSEEQKAESQLSLSDDSDQELSPEPETPQLPVSKPERPVSAIKRLEFIKVVYQNEVLQDER